MPYKTTQDELNEIIRCHQLFLNRRKGGKQAKLRGVDLSGAGLHGVNFTWADLWKANLEGTDLSGANLTNVNLIDADLSWSKLRNADLTGALLIGAKLSGADLSGANLEAANLSFTVGNNQEILTVHADGYHVNITDDQIWIDGCHHAWDKWMSLNDNEIVDDIVSKISGPYLRSQYPSGEILEWWHEWKPRLNQIINDRKHQRGIIIIDIETAPDSFVKKY